MLHRRVQLLIVLIALIGVGLAAYRYLHLVRPTADVRVDEGIVELGTKDELKGVDENTGTLEQIELGDDGTIQLEQLPADEGTSKAAGSTQ